MGEAVSVSYAKGERRNLQANVFISPDPDLETNRDTSQADEGAGLGGGVAVAEPLMVKVITEPWHPKYITITDSRGGRLITVIEWNSPSDKGGGGLEHYRKKRQEVLMSGASLVEMTCVARAIGGSCSGRTRCPNGRRRPTAS